MDGDKDRGAGVTVEKLPPFLRDADDSSHHRLSRGGAQADDHLRVNDLDLRLQPGLAGYHLPDQRLLMQASLAPLDPFKMLHGVGDVNLVARNARFSEGFVQETTCRSDERVALAIFHIAWLFTDEHDARVFRPLAENRLGRVLVQIAPFARTCSGPQALESMPLGQECGSRRFL